MSHPLCIYPTDKTLSEKISVMGFPQKLHFMFLHVKSACVIQAFWYRLGYM